MISRKLAAACLAPLILGSALVGACEAGGKIRNPMHGKFRVKNDSHTTLKIGLFSTYQEKEQGVVKFWGYRRILPGNHTDFGYAEFRNERGKLHTFFLSCDGLNLRPKTNADMELRKSTAPFPNRSFSKTLQNALVTRHVVQSQWTSIKQHWPSLRVNHRSCYEIIPRRSGMGAALYIKPNGYWTSIVSR